MMKAVLCCPQEFVYRLSVLPHQHAQNLRQVDPSDTDEDEYKIKREGE